MLSKVKRRLGDSQAGFTLIELLVVITILGILAAVVVFSVGGINNRGQDAACDTDLSTLRTAQEAYFAKNNTYAATQGDLVTVPNKFLSKESIWYDTSGTGTTVSYTLKGFTPPASNPCPGP